MLIESTNTGASFCTFAILSAKLISSILIDGILVSAGFFFGTVGLGPRPGLGAVTGRFGGGGPFLLGEIVVVVGVGLLGELEVIGRIGMGGAELLLGMELAFGRGGTAGLVVGVVSLILRACLGGGGRGSSLETTLFMGGGGRARFEREGISGTPLSRFM